MATSKAKKHPHRPQPHEPFHMAVHRLRTTAYHSEASLASMAGMPVALWRSMELGHAPYSLVFYNAATTRYPQLKVYPPPGPDPVIISPVTPPAVTDDHARTQMLVDILKTLNVGRVNRKIVENLMRMCVDGFVTHGDITRYVT